MTALRTTHRTTVTEDMIDHLGHMNVMHYGTAARAASDVLVRELGATGDFAVTPVDLYQRHFREQLLGADLEVRSLVLGAGSGSLRLYHELRNRDTDDLAASFVHRLEAHSGGRPVPGWPAVDVADADIPEHGRPRSIDIDADPIASAPSLAALRADEVLALRRPREVGAEETGPDGAFDPAKAPMLVWGGEPLQGATGPVLHPGPNGELVGWATLENRMAVRRLPREGDRVQSFAATVALQDKVAHRVFWVHDLDREELLVTFEVIDVALDTVGRRAVSIPDDLRRHAEERLRAHLLPR